MRAVGFLAGVGTLLHEARALGVDVVGNVDTRPYFNDPWVWKANFKEPFTRSIDEAKAFDDWRDVDIALGHPPCGSFSNLGAGGAKLERFTSDEHRLDWHKTRNAKLGLLPQFLDLVNTLQPKTFALDNLVKMLKAFPTTEWERALPGYRVTFVEMTNRDYGSCQVRKRLWVIGSRLGVPFRFRPTKEALPGPKNVWGAIEDLPWEPWIDVPELTHIHLHPSWLPQGGFWVNEPDGSRGRADVVPKTALGFLSMPVGNLWTYANVEGRHTHKPAHTRLSIDHPCRTPSGNDTLRHPFTAWPLTPRERARIMGWPDDFKLWDSDTPPTRLHLMKLVRATGRAVPSEFPRFLIPQLVRHVRKHA